MANNIQIANGKVVQDGADRFIEFNLNWENSWRISSPPNNWDAAWVFVKYRVPAEYGGDHLWKHVWLNTTDSAHSSGTGTGAVINIGTTSIGGTNRGMGALIYRLAVGTGAFSTTGTRLRWEFAAQDLAATTPVEISVFAIEVVYVAEGMFSVGDGTTTNVQQHFRDGVGNIPFLISSEGQLTLGGTTAGNLASGLPTFGSKPDDFNDTTTQTLPAAYPKGFAAFYMMKYSISQQQYVDFLNTLTSAQASSRAYTGGGFRHGISVSEGVYSTTNPFVTNTFMDWMDGAAYLDWSGLRPMTELEYEKAARGPVGPVANEYAWGSDELFGTDGNPAGQVDGYTLNQGGAGNESLAPSNALVADEGNALWRGNARSNFSSNPIDGPARVGIFAALNSTRAQAGASYWGIMELSGNVWERLITVGNATGRGFTGLNGDGSLAANGDADVSHWPGTNGIGSGHRGGSWADPSQSLRVSDRDGAVHEFGGRFPTFGFRGVRSAPQ